MLLSGVFDLYFKLHKEKKNSCQYFLNFGLSIQVNKFYRYFLRLKCLVIINTVSKCLWR